MDFIGQLNRILEPIRTRIRSIVNRAIASLIDDTTAMQIVQLRLMKDETKSNVERVQNYGFSSVPLEGSETVVLFVNGNKDHGLVIAIDDSRYRVKNGAPGQVTVYDNDGNFVKLTEAEGIEINAPNEKVVIKASGDIDIGNTSLKSLINEEFASIYNNHVHNFTAAPSGTFSTSTPADRSNGIPSTPVGDIPATFVNQLNSNQMTSKVKAQ